MEIVTKYDDLVQIHRLTIDVVLECADPIAATEILPLQKDDKYDELALDYYNDFILDTIALFDSHDFVILEERKSPHSYSEYFVLVKQQDVDNDNYQFVLFIRLSDHDNRKLTRKGTQKFYSDKAESLKTPKSKKKQKWKLKEITVNNKRYSTYEEALSDIDNRLSKYD